MYRYGNTLINCCCYIVLPVSVYNNSINLRARVGYESIDDGNGSENVSFKMNSRFFNLCRVYSNLLKMASEGEFP